MRAPLVSRLAAVAITAASIACGDSFTTHGISEPDLLEIQASRDWTEPGDTIVVRLRAKVQGGEDGFGIPGIVLRLSVTRGGGSVVPDSVITDQDGAASVQWVVGSVEDTQTVRADAPNISTSTGLRARWRVRSVEVDTAGMSVVIDSARLRVNIRNRFGEAITRDFLTQIEATPEIVDQPVAELSGHMLIAQGPGSVTLRVSSEGVDAPPVVVRVAPRIAVLVAFDQSEPAVGGETVIARGYRLDLAAGLTIGGTPAATTLIDSATLRVVLPPIDVEPCRGTAYLPAALSTGVVRSRGVRVRRSGELTLALGEVVRLGPSSGGCLRLAPVPGARYVLMYADTRPIISARGALFPPYIQERFNFAVGLDRWEGGPMTWAPPTPAPSSAGGTGQTDVVRPSAAGAAAPPDAIELRATPWQVGDRASVQVAGVYESGKIVSVTGPFVALVLDNDPILPAHLANYEAAMEDVQRDVVPMLRAAFSDRTPVTSAGSGQFVIAISQKAALGHAGLFFGPAAAVMPSDFEPPFALLAHELAHAWQDRFNRDHCVIDVPFGCWRGSQWAIEGGAAFLSQEAWRRLHGAPLIGADADIYASMLYACCGPAYSVVFGDGYGSASWFLRETLARAVAGGAAYDDAIAAVSRGSLEGWYGFAPRSSTPLGGLTNRLTALLGAWNAEDAFEAAVWGLGMDETPSSTYQHLAAVDYHLGGMGMATLATQIAGDSFGHVQLDDRGAGGAYRYSVGADGIVWAVGRVH